MNNHMTMGGEVTLSDVSCHDVFVYQNHDEYVMAIGKIGCKEAARQLYREYEGMQEHGTLTEMEAIQVLLRIQLLADDIY